MVIQLPEKVDYIIRTIEEAGYEAYAVGGCVRDAALGRTPNDWDVTTSAKPEAVKALFHRTFDTGLQHGTVTVVLEHENFEVTTYRVDGDYADGRHPDKVTFTASLEEDVKRRDFTINAMAYHPERGLVDLFGGQEDLEKQVIRCVGNPRERFTEDALRMMRAVRFAAQLGFTIDPDTYEAMREMAPRLSLVSQERITDEMLKLLVSPNPTMFLHFYELGMTKIFFPAFDEMMACSQNTKYHCYTVGMHTMKVVEAIPPEKIFRLTALLHDVGKRRTKTEKDGVEHFYGHAAVGEKEARDILRGWKLDNYTIQLVTRLVAEHEVRFEITEENVRKKMRRVGKDLMPRLLELIWADMAGKSTYAQEQREEELLEFERLTWLILARDDATSVGELAVTGQDLIRAGIPQGKAVGEWLEKMLEAVLRDPALNTKEQLLGMLL